MGRMQRQKGKSGERECAAELAAILGVVGRRGAQNRGGPDSPDVVLDGVELHVEAKRCERLALWPAVEQAKRDSAGRPWLVWHRPNHRESICVIATANLLEVAREIVLQAGMGEAGETGPDPVADGWVGKDGRP